MTGELLAATSPSKSQTRRLLIWVLAGAAALLLTTAATIYVVWPKTFTLHGALDLGQPFTTFVDGGCFGENGFDDLHEGAQVVVSDQGGRTIALGRLDYGKADGSRCRFPFTVTGVPAGKRFYGVEISRRGLLQYTEARMREGVSLSIG